MIVLLSTDVGYVSLCCCIDEQITSKERFLLLDGSDLKELGFLMGPRKQLLQWIAAENGAGLVSPSLPTMSQPLPSSSQPSSPAASTSVHRTMHQEFALSSSSSAGGPRRKFQVIAVIIVTNSCLRRQRNNC